MPIEHNSYIIQWLDSDQYTRMVEIEADHDSWPARCNVVHFNTEQIDNCTCSGALKREQNIFEAGDD